MCFHNVYQSSQCILLNILTILFVKYTYIRASLVAQRVKNLPANAEDPGLIPGSGRPPGEGNVNSLQYSYLEYWTGIPWTEEPGGLQSMESQRVRNT